MSITDLKFEIDRDSKTPLWLQIRNELFNCLYRDELRPGQLIPNEKTLVELFNVSIGPTKGNIEGGLTTIEEKALGNIQKIGKKCMVDGVLDKAEMPTSKGLWFMDSSSAAAEMVTLCAASGYVAHLFPTGQGNIIGNPILPVIKVCANPRTVRTMSEHVDVDVTALLKRDINMDQAGDMLLESLIHTSNGRMTAAEILGHQEFVLTRLYESA